jgi:8-oxo-dGTP diphosphatase
MLCGISGRGSSPAGDGNSPIHVVAGVVRDASGRVLIAERPAGKHLAGLWEFPGGKIDHGEKAFDALRRELAEEIGIAVERAEPLISVPWSYPGKSIVLDAWTVEAYAGRAVAREGQALRWIAPEQLDDWPMPPADVPIVHALQLPDRYLITPPLRPGSDDAVLRGIERACIAGIRLIQLRQPAWKRDDIARIAVEARAICARHRCELLVNADWRLAQACGLDGVHLPARIAADLDARPIADDRWLGVSCHDRGELDHAQRIGADFATLAPLAPTPSHPDAAVLGWTRFAELAAASPLPVYALGGLAVADVAIACRSGAQGIAAIRALWP